MFRGFGLLLLVCLLITFLPVKTAAAVNDDLAVVFVLDNSGSMRGNDPEKLRFSAAGMLTDLLLSRDRVGLVSFSNAARVLVPLSGLETREQRNSIKEALANAQNGEDWTDLNAGLAAAFTELEKAQGQGVVILVSDGEPETGPGFRSNETLKQDYLNKLMDTTTRFSAKGWPIYSIGLSTEADISLLQKLSKETGGTMFRAPEAGALPGIFQDILGGLRDSIALGEFAMPLALDQWGEPNLIRVGKGLKLLTFRGLSTDGRQIELQVKDPAGNLLTEGAQGLTLVKGANYYSVSIDNPQAGNWLVQAKGGGIGRVKVEGLSQFVLESLQPATRGALPVGSTVRFRIKGTENGLPLVSPEFKLKLERDGQEILALNLDPLEPGMFTGEINNLLKLPGPQEFRLILSDSTGELCSKDLFYYGLDAPYLEIKRPLVAWQGEPSRIETTLMYKDKPLTESGFQVKAKVIGPNNTWDADLPNTGALYSAEYTPINPGSYKLSLSLNGTFHGRGVSYATGDIQFTVGVRPMFKLNIGRELYVGQKGILQVQVQSMASSTEQMTIGGSVGKWEITPQSLQLTAGEIRTLNLQVPWEGSDITSVGQIKLSGPNLKEQVREVNVRFLTPLEDYWYTYRFVLTVGAFLLALLCLWIGLGNLLYRYFTHSLRLNGMLVLGLASSPVAPRRLVPLRSFGKASIILGWGEEADIRLAKDSEPEQRGVVLHLDTRLEQSRSKYLTGWSCLFGRRRVVIMASSTGGAFRLKEKRAKWSVARTQTVLRDGDEINFHGCRILFRQ